MVLFCLGSSHFVATYKREVLIECQRESFQLGAIVSFLHTDFTCFKKGGYRLATYDNYTYHLGNTIEDWMTAIFNGLK
jgi:hypothetical protein